MNLTLTDFFHKYKFKLLLTLFILISVRYVFYNEILKFIENYKVLIDLSMIVFVLLFLYIGTKSFNYKLEKWNDKFLFIEIIFIKVGIIFNTFI